MTRKTLFYRAETALQELIDDYDGRALKHSEESKARVRLISMRNQLEELRKGTGRI